jgi:hypothetical protein
LLNAGEREESKSLFDTTEDDYEKIMNTNAKSGMSLFLFIQVANIF